MTGRCVWCGCYLRRINYVAGDGRRLSCEQAMLRERYDRVTEAMKRWNRGRR